LVGSSSLNKSPPFHVIEEEGLLFVGVVELAERNRTADVEAKHVQA
jgi:hypothetical protein